MACSTFERRSPPQRCSATRPSCAASRRVAVASTGSWTTTRRCRIRSRRRSSPSISPNRRPARSTELVLDFDRFAVLTFDCYGTLIDWESGILAAMRPIAQAHGNRADDATLLETYAAAEADAEAGPYRPYADILREAVITVGDRLDFSPTAKEADAFAASIVTWPAFPDSADALARLRTRFKLAALTN